MPFIPLNPDMDFEQSNNEYAEQPSFSLMSAIMEDIVMHREGKVEIPDGQSRTGIIILSTNGQRHTGRWTSLWPTALGILVIRRIIFLPAWIMICALKCSGREPIPCLNLHTQTKNLHMMKF